jgi:NADPH:quinone reductase-like Zn-dependent oxidoreductase/short-subunit dehydrogenase/acyl carrier protein
LHVADECELAVRSGQWWAGRVERAVDDDVLAERPPRRGSATAAASRHVAVVQTTGMLESLHWRAASASAIGAHDVEIAVAATGLNFRDLLGVLGEVPAAKDGQRRLGLECAGVITRIGSAVRGFAVGERVMAVCENALGSHAVAHAALVARIPDGVPTEEASGFPMAFLTAARALEQLARLQRGERVLIHSAAGGVGLAALQLAQRIGAEVFATAGTAEKRALLLHMGVEHVFDSRSVAWGDAVLRATDGAGVDVVLNSLGGEAIDEGLRVLAPYGRFIEIGRRDVAAGKRIGMDVLLSQAMITMVDLLAQLRDRPESLGPLLTDLTGRLACGELQLLPTTRWRAADMADAFRSFLPGTHVGKVVVLQDGTAAPTAGASGTVPVRADGTYLITGGLGSLGRRAAGWLVSQGAQQLVLVSRSTAGTAVERDIAAWRASGVRVTLVAADVSTSAGLAAMRTALDALPPLAGIVHAAGVLDDGVLTAQTPGRMRTVAAPKIGGALQLSLLAQESPPDFVVFYSSVAGALGTRGQANYAAANAFLDAQAFALRARGIAATSLGFGPFGDAGMATEQNRLETLAAAGVGALRLEHADAALARFCGGSNAHVIIAVFDAAVWTAANGTAAERHRYASLLTAVAAPAAAMPSAHDGLHARLAAAVGARQRGDVMLAFVRAEAAVVLRSTVERVEPGKALKALGIDSLTSLELRARLERATGLQLSGTLVFSFPTASAIAAHLLERLEASEPANQAALPAEVSASESAADAEQRELDALAQALTGMGDDEVRRLLAEQGGEVA